MDKTRYSGQKSYFWFYLHLSSLSHACGVLRIGFFLLFHERAHNLRSFLFLKGQSHGDFPIFFVTILINLYQSTLFTHELLLDHLKGTILNEFSKQKQAKISF